jgi:hypothetical protein
MTNLLRQLRAGYHVRGAGQFPTSVALIGMRDVRDYLVAAKDGHAVNTGSPFNVTTSVTLGNFTRGDIAALYAQHTADTGQAFTDAAVERAWWWSAGQPYLVNALASECVRVLVPDRSLPVGPDAIDDAKERLVLARVTHLDNLAERLREDRVARVVLPILLGDVPDGVDTTTDDFQYAVDLGLVRRGRSAPEIANPLYREVLARQLSQRRQDNLPSPWWKWLHEDGTLDMEALVDAFLAWWREHADILVETDQSAYREAAAHLAFMGFLQRVVNGGGKVYREYAAGRGRIDLLVEFGGGRHVVELKRVAPNRAGLERVRGDGIAQLEGYLGTLGLTEGWLLIFDQRPDRSWDDKLWREEVEANGRLRHLRGG